MTDERDVVDGMVTQAYIKEPLNRYPEVRVSTVHFLGNEIQIEQGHTAEPLDPKDPANSVVSVSKEQALLIAAQINAALGKE